MESNVTAQVTRTHGGTPRWGLLCVGLVDGRPRLFLPYKVSVGTRRFLTRLILLRTPLIALDVTRIHAPDDGREWPHDHNRSFLSWKLGSYDEWVYSDPEDLTRRELRRHRRLSARWLRHTQAHSITRVSPRLVTVTFLGPVRRKANYWTPDGMQSTGMKADEEVQVNEVQRVR